MSREKGSFLDAFYNTPSNHKDKNEVKQKTKVVTYSLSGFLNHLIEEDMKQHPDIVEMTAALSSMKE